MAQREVSQYRRDHKLYNKRAAAKGAIGDEQGAMKDYEKGLEIEMVDSYVQSTWDKDDD